MCINYQVLREFQERRKNTFQLCASEQIGVPQGEQSPAAAVGTLRVTVPPAVNRIAVRAGPYAGRVEDPKSPFTEIIEPTAGRVKNVANFSGELQWILIKANIKFAKSGQKRDFNAL